MSYRDVWEACLYANGDENCTLKGNIDCYKDCVGCESFIDEIAEERTIIKSEFKSKYKKNRENKYGVK